MVTKTYLKIILLLLKKHGIDHWGIKYPSKMDAMSLLIELKLNPLALIRVEPFQ